MLFLIYINKFTFKQIKKYSNKLIKNKNKNIKKYN